MQTTLLGLAITFIVALIAALIGPYFIDWNRFRPQFETEATRVMGVPVRVVGALEARLLPSPSLRLRSVVVGGPNDSAKVRADNLAIEFSLGSLMRGEWRATELTINGVALDLSLDNSGRIEWPLSSQSLNLGSLSIDRLNLTGRVALYDAASHSMLELNDVAFSGDVRSPGGFIRGDGNFMLSGVRHPFRISSGRVEGAKGSRVHLAIDPGTRAASVDLNGILSFDDRAPHFDGALRLAGAAESGGDNFSGEASQRPWRLSAKVKAEPNGARLRDIDASFGPGDSALKLAGVGEVRFGASPRIQAALFARHLDADRLLAKDHGSAKEILSTLRDLLAKIPKTPLETGIKISADQIMLGGRPIQDFDADLRGDDAAWSISRLELRAPGATKVTVSGQVAEPGPSAHFDGALDIESSDPDTFVAWLQGRSEITHLSRKPLRLRSNVTMEPSGMVFDQLEADIEGGTVEGRLAFVDPTAGKGARADAELRADRLDLQAAAGLVRAIAGPEGGWPDEGRLSLNVDRAISAGQELRPFIAKLSYGPKTISLEQLKIGSPGDLTTEGSGAFDRMNATGQLSLSMTSDSVARMTSLIAPVAPAVAARLDRMPSEAGAARLDLTLNVDKSSDDKNNAEANAKLEVDLPQLKGTISLVAAPPLAAIRAADLDALARSRVTAQAKLSAERGNALPVLLGLDRVIAIHDGPVRLEGTATGIWHAPIRLDAKMSGADLDAEIKGDVEPWTPGRKADVDLAVRRVDLGPLLNLKPSDSGAQNVRISSHVTLADSKLVFGKLDATAAGAHLRGRVAVDMGSENVVEGEIGMDQLDLASVFGLAIGAAGHATEPLRASLPEGWRGQVAFNVLHGTLPGGAEVQPISGVIKADDQSLTFDAMKAKIGGGEATARLHMRKAADGFLFNAEVQLKNVNGPALHYGALVMPVGRTSAQISLASHGRSASALVGALSGNGVVALEGARIQGLGPHAFDVAIHASGGGQTSDDKLQQIVQQSLSASPLRVASAQIPFTVSDGRLRVGATTLQGDGAKAIISGGYDIAADQVDIRASLASTSAGSENDRPEIGIFAVGPPNAINRTVNVATLSSWLAVKAIDRETRRLDSIAERLAPSPADTPLPAEAPLPTKPPDVAALSAPETSPPITNVPVPKRDPRRATVSSPAAAPGVAVLPAPEDSPAVFHPPVPDPDPRRSLARSRIPSRPKALPRRIAAPPQPSWFARLPFPFQSPPAQAGRRR